MSKSCNCVSFTLPQCHLNIYEYSEGDWNKYQHHSKHATELLLLPSQLMRPAAFLHSLKFCVSHDLQKVNWQGLIESRARTAANTFSSGEDGSFRIQQDLHGTLSGVRKSGDFRTKTLTLSAFEVPFGRSSYMSSGDKTRAAKVWVFISCSDCCVVRPQTSTDESSPHAPFSWAYHSWAGKRRLYGTVN